MGSFHCKTSIIDESDKKEINLNEKSRNRNNMIDKDIIKIRNFNEKIFHTERKKLNDILKEATFHTEKDFKLNQNNSFHKKSQCSVDEGLENTPKLKLELNILKNKEIYSTKQYADLSRLINNNPDDTLTKSVIDSEKIDSLKSSLNSQVKKINAYKKYKVKEDISNNLKIPMRAKKNHDHKFPSANPSFVNNNESTARRKSQVFIVEPPELTDRSKDYGEMCIVNNYHNKSISIDKSLGSHYYTNKKEDKIINYPYGEIDIKMENKSKKDIILEGDLNILKDKLNNNEYSEVNRVHYILTQNELRITKSKDNHQEIKINLSKVVKIEEYKEKEINNEGNVKYIKLIYFDETSDQNIKIPVNLGANMFEMDNNRLKNISERARAKKNTPIKKCLDVPSPGIVKISSNKSTIRSNSQSNSLIIGIDNILYSDWINTINSLIPDK